MEDGTEGGIESAVGTEEGKGRFLSGDALQCEPHADHKGDTRRAEEEPVSVVVRQFVMLPWHGLFAERDSIEWMLEDKKERSQGSMADRVLSQHLSTTLQSFQGCLIQSIQGCRWCREELSEPPHTAASACDRRRAAHVRRH